MTTALRVRGLRKNYGDAAALAGVDLDVAAGEIFALLGPNGAGKSTAVEILEGLRGRDGAEALADRVGVLAKGRLVEVNAPQRLGGRDRAEAIVSWEEDGRRCEEHTAEPTRFVAELSTLFRGEIPGLSVVRPSLEDIYL